MPYAVFSLILPELTLEEQVSMIRDAGYDGIEVRIADIAPEHRGKPFSFWGNHRDPIGPSNLAASLPRLRRETAAAGVTVCGLAPYVRCTDPEAFTPVAAAARDLEVPLVRVTAPAYDGRERQPALFDRAVAGLTRIETTARDAGVRAALEIHHGTIAPSTSAARRLLEGLDPAHVGAIFDPGNMVHEGYENWALGLETLGPYLAHVHVKNAVWVLKDKPTGGPYVWQAAHAPLREGAADWRAIRRALDGVGYDGWLTLEDFSPGPAREKLEDALAFLKQIAG